MTGKKPAGGSVGRKLQMSDEEDIRLSAQKRKSKQAAGAVQTPDLNQPAVVSNAIVPVGLVSSRVNQMDGSTESSGGSLEEIKKEQRRGSYNARSAAATSDSPCQAP